MYKTMTAREISELLDIPISTILRQVSKFGLEHDEETKNRIRKERNKSLRNYWNKEKYASKGRKLHMQYKIDELRVLSGKPQETRLRIRKLSPKALNAKMYLRKSYNYFYSDGEPFVLCYDAETKRHPKEEYYTRKFGFKFVCA